MDPQTASLLSLISKYLWAPIAAWVWKDMRQAKRDVEDLKTEVAVLKLDAHNTKEVVSAFRAEVKESITEVKTTMKEHATKTDAMILTLTEISKSIAKMEGREEGR